LDSVEQAIVVPIENPEYGTRPIAFVKSSGHFDPDRIRDQLRDLLPGYKLPDRIFGWPSQAATSGIKPDRQELARLARHLAGHH
jgi:o-succinylbenzoate---CoA ligase